MTIDAANYHRGHGPDSDDSACWHIVTVLLWCAKAGYLAPTHKRTKLEKDPVEYFYTSLGGKLFDTDLTSEGAAFVHAIYSEYEAELADLAVTHEIETVYHFCAQPNAKEIRGWMFEYLDEEHARYLRRKRPE